MAPFFKKLKGFISPLVWAGFTVIEVIMVIVIVAILVILAIPRFEAFYAIKLEGAVRKVVENIRYVQQLAISKHNDCRIEFDAADDSYQACYCNEADGQCDAGACGDTNWSAIIDPFSRLGLSVDFTIHNQYKGVDISSPDFGGTNTLRFDWQGIPQNSTRSNLTTSGSVSFSYHNNSRTVYVEPNTGLVKRE